MNETVSIYCLLVVEILVGGEGLSELPPLRHDVFEDEVLAAGGHEREAEALADEPAGEAVPVGAPVPVHGDPVRVGALHRHALDGAAAGDVADEHHVEAVEDGDGESHTAALPALDPLVEDGDDADVVDADVLLGGLGHAEVGAGRAAPAAGRELPWRGGPSWAGQKLVAETTAQLLPGLHHPVLLLSQMIT